MTLRWPSLLRAWCALVFVAMTAGCATTQGSSSPEAKASGAPATSTPNASAGSSTGTTADTIIRLRVQAPATLEALLLKHLDLARLARITSNDGLSDYELRRIEAVTPNQVRSLLETEGYFDPDVRVLREGQAVDGATRVAVIVEPGKRTTVQTLKFDFQGELERQASAGNAEAKATIEMLRDLWPMPEGAWFRYARWTDGKAALLAKLRAEGYAAATWAGTTAEVDASLHEATITLVLDSGPRYKLGELKIEGVTKQSETTLKNLTGYEQGAPATEATLLDFQERLLRTGLFDRASVVLDTDNAKPEGTPVLVRVQESSLQQATFGVGYSANTGPRFSVEHTHRRIFGARATLRNKLEVGRLRQAWEGELSSHAQPNLYRNLIGGTFERLVAADDSDVVRSGRVRVGRTRETTTREHFTFVQLERADRSAAALQLDERITALSINHHAVWRRVDSVVLPTDGQSLSMQTGAGWAWGVTGLNTHERGAYGRALARLSVWRPLGGQFYGQARVEFGQVFARETLALPQTQLFRVGGDDSVRGYAYRSLGPVTAGTVGGGRVMSTVSMEVARPVSEALPSVWWATFIDAGQAADRWSELKPVWGAGLGVRWRSPVGPLSVDWAWGDAKRRGRLHLSVGVVF